MKLHQLLIFFFCASGVAFGGPTNTKSNLSPKLKKKVEKEFISFHQENQILREKHQNELYEDQKVILEKTHKKTLVFFREISKLQQTISLGNLKENKKIQEEIERRKKLFKGKLHEDRRKVRKKMSSRRDKFQKVMKKRRKVFKNKVKTYKKEN
jgi:hypothetical protein